MVVGKELDVVYRDEIAEDNKAEVAKGLCDPKELEKKAFSSESDTSIETVSIVFSCSTNSCRI